jgi:hypothetical protein
MTSRTYKDSVFSLLFSDPDALRELYGAIEGVSLGPSVPVKINTLEGALFMERINDISFEIAGKVVVLIEHQSTINPNMALRLLMYIARVYEKIIDNKVLYSTKKTPISGLSSSCCTTEGPPVPTKAGSASPIPSRPAKGWACPAGSRTWNWR